VLILAMCPCQKVPGRPRDDGMRPPGRMECGAPALVAIPGQLEIAVLPVEGGPGERAVAGVQYHAAGSRAAAAREVTTVGFDEQVDRTGVVQSCEDLMRFQAMFARHFAHSVARQLGPEGEAAVLGGLHRYGRYRAELIRRALARVAIPPTARAVVTHWDMADYHLASETDTGTIEGGDRAVTVTLRDPVEWQRWRTYEAGVDVARLYYRGVLPGLAEGLGATVAFDPARLDLQRPWPVTWSLASAPDGPAAPVHSHLFDRLDDAVEVARRTSMNNGALYYFCADAVTKRLDMLGEGVIRQVVRDLAHERADHQKTAHLAAGWELNVKTLMDHWDGQLISIWQFAPGVLTEGTWHQDCTWCPYAAVWGEFGQRGLDLGYLYDYELHPTYYRRYHPDMVVQFEGIKTRGDATCKFRISMPSRQRPDEPRFRGYTGHDV